MDLFGPSLSRSNLFSMKKAIGLGRGTTLTRSTKVSSSLIIRKISIFLVNSFKQYYSSFRFTISYLVRDCSFFSCVQYLRCAKSIMQWQFFLREEDFGLGLGFLVWGYCQLRVQIRRMTSSDLHCWKLYIRRYSAGLFQRSISSSNHFCSSP